MTDQPIVDEHESLFGTEVRETLPGGLAEAEPSLEFDLEVEGDVIATAEPIPLTQWQLFIRRFKRHKLGLVSLGVLIALFIMCYTVGWWMPFEKGQQDLSSGTQTLSPSFDHLMGTDQLGRDYFTEILYAGQISLRIGLTVALLSTTIGPTQLGRMWRVMIRGPDAPTARAASTNSFSFRDRVWPRTTRAIHIQKRPARM